jgi:molybdate transport system permease protein
MHLDPWSAIRISALVGILTSVIGFPIAVSVGWLLARKQFVGKSLVGALVLAPLVMPPIVLGLGLLRVFGHRSWLGEALATVGISIPFGFEGVVLASLLVGMPLYVLASRDAFVATDVRYEELARTFGQRPWKAFWSTSFPLAVPGIACGALLAFARALGEFGATAVIAGNIEGKTRTISLAVYSLLDSPGNSETMYVLVGASLGIGLTTIVAYEMLAHWQRRRLGLHHG